MVFFDESYFNSNAFVVLIDGVTGEFDTSVVRGNDL